MPPIPLAEKKARLEQQLAEVNKQLAEKPVTHAEVADLRKKAAEAEEKFLAAGRQYHADINGEYSDSATEAKVQGASLDHLTAAANAYGEAKNALEQAAAKLPVPKPRGPRKPKVVTE